MKRRILAILLTLALILSVAPLQIFAASVTALKGSGTDTDPYRISTPDELVFAAQQMNAGTAAYVGKYYSLTGNIDMSSVSEFPMIKSFTGILNGMGYTISNLTVSDFQSDGFGYGGHCTLQRLRDRLYSQELRYGS